MTFPQARDRMDDEKKDDGKQRKGYAHDITYGRLHSSLVFLGGVFLKTTYVGT